MIRFLIAILCLATVGQAVASPSARLEALADDGMLIEDAGGDGRWPALVGRHALRWALRSADRDGDPFLALDMRRSLGAGVAGRCYIESMAGIRNAQPRVQVQGAKPIGPLILGLGLGYDGAFEHASASRSVRTAQMGLRWTLSGRTVIDGTLDVGTWTAGASDGEAESLRRWRLRGHHAVNDHLVLVAVVERGLSDPPTAAVWNDLSRNDLFDDTDHIEAGVLIWPDEDSQVTVSWLERSALGRRQLTDDEPWAQGGRWNDRGLHLSFEVRPSAWGTLRLGCEMIDAWPAEAGRDGASVGHESRSRLGIGATCHLGDVDLSFAWSQGDGIDGSPWRGDRRDLAAFSLDVVVLY